MKLIPQFVAGAYEAPSPAINIQQCVNLLVEIDKNQAKTPTAHYGVPGLDRKATIGTGAHKASITVNGVMYAAIGNNFGRVEADLSYTVLGSYNGTGRITLISNGLQVLVIDGLSGFVFDIDAMTWTQVTDPGFTYGATQATFQDGYGIIALPNTSQFGISGLYNFLSWDSIDFANAEGLPDNVATVISNHRLLHVLGSNTLELWSNTGAATFPFQRVDGAFFDTGCVAPYTATVADDSVFWLGNNPQGALCFYRMQGQQPLRISTLALETELETYTVVSDAFAFGIDIRKHPIYVCVFPTANRTWCYDAHSGSWFEWLDWDGVEYKRWRINSFTQAYDQMLIGDYRDGRLYALTFDKYTNDGDPIRWLRVCPYIFNMGQRLFHSRLEVFIQPGVGELIGTTDPVMSLRWTDNGRKWSNEVMAPMGRFGNYNERVIWNRLGSSRNRAYEISGSAPVKTVIYGASLEVTVQQGKK